MVRFELVRPRSAGRLTLSLPCGTFRRGSHLSLTPEFCLALQFKRVAYSSGKVRLFGFTLANQHSSLRHLDRHALYITIKLNSKAPDFSEALMFWE